MKGEEKVFYSALEQNNKTKSLALQSRKEHQAAEKILNDMMKTKGDDARFQAGFNMLKQSIQTHRRGSGVQRSQGYFQRSAGETARAELHGRPETDSLSDDAEGGLIKFRNASS